MKSKVCSEEQTGSQNRTAEGEPSSRAEREVVGCFEILKLKPKLSVKKVVSWPLRCPCLHPGVGPLTALTFELVIGTPDRFQCAKQIASYVGLVPSEQSSGDRRRLGHISKQGNALLRFLLVEAAQVTVRSQSQWRSQFFHLALRRGRKIAKVAMAKKLAVELYWMWRRGWDYADMQRLGSHAGEPGNRQGVQ
jgi:hypothetical protein